MHYIFSSIKKTNKVMCVLLCDVFRYLLLTKIDVLKSFKKSKFLGKKHLKKCTSFEEQKGARYIREIPFILALLSSAAFCLQNLFSDFF